jgi:hypothetical protein
MRLNIGFYSCGERKLGENCFNRNCKRIRLARFVLVGDVFLLLPNNMQGYNFIVIAQNETSSGTMLQQIAFITF